MNKMLYSQNYVKLNCVCMKTIIKMRSNLKDNSFFKDLIFVREMFKELKIYKRVNHSFSSKMVGYITRNH